MCVTMNDCPNVVALRMSGKLLEQVISSERSNEGERDPFIHQEERIQGKLCIPSTINIDSILDVLCRQLIKLFQVVSTSEFHEY